MMWRPQYKDNKNRDLEQSGSSIISGPLVGLVDFFYKTKSLFHTPANFHTFEYSLWKLSILKQVELANGGLTPACVRAYMYMYM